MSFNFSEDLLSQMTSNSQMSSQLAPMESTNSQMSTHLMAPTNSQMSTHLMAPTNGQMLTHLMPPNNSQMSTHLMEPSRNQMSTQLATSSQDNTWCSGDSQSLLASQMNPIRNDQTVPAIVPKIIAAAEQVKKNKYTAPKWTNGLLKSTTEKKKNEEMMKSMSQDLNEVKNQLTQISQNQASQQNQLTQISQNHASQHEKSRKFVMTSLKVCISHHF